MLGITPLIAAAGLDYWEGEAPGPFTGCSEAERLDAVKLALELGNDINARADFGNYPMVGDLAYTLLYYPLNMDELVGKGVGDPRWNGSTALHGAVVSGQPSIVKYLLDRGARVDAKTKLGWTPLMWPKACSAATRRRSSRRLRRSSGRRMASARRHRAPAKATLVACADVGAQQRHRSPT